MIFLLTSNEDKAINRCTRRKQQEFLLCPRSVAAVRARPGLAHDQRRGQRLPDQRAGRAERVQHLRLQGAGRGDRHHVRYGPLGYRLPSRVMQTRVYVPDTYWEGAKQTAEFTRPRVLWLPSMLSEGCKEFVQRKEKNASSESILQVCLGVYTYKLCQLSGTPCNVTEEFPLAIAQMGQFNHFSKILA